MKELTFPVCSFCGQRKAQVRFMVVAHRAAICAECVADCVSIILEATKEESSSSAADLEAPSGVSAEAAREGLRVG